ncbi:MAG: hypothetical protein RLZZ157_1701 [Pseudomonadota bacterium]
MAGEAHAVAGAEHAGKAAESSFPPFDSSLFSSQIFWFWVAFGALYFVLAAVVIPKIAQTLALRANTIEADLKAAAEQTAAAQDARALAEKAAAQARAQARKTLEDMRLVNDAALAKADAEASAQANAKIAAAEADIAATRQSALAAIQDSVGDLASAIVERVSGVKPTAKALSAAVASTLQQERAS